MPRLIKHAEEWYMRRNMPIRAHAIDSHVTVAVRMRAREIWKCYDGKRKIAARSAAEKCYDGRRKTAARSAAEKCYDGRRKTSCENVITSSTAARIAKQYPRAYRPRVDTTFQHNYVFPKLMWFGRTTFPFWNTWRLSDRLMDEVIQERILSWEFYNRVQALWQKYRF